MLTNPCLTLVGSRVADPVTAGSNVIQAESCLLNAVCPYGGRASEGEALRLVRQGLQFSSDAVYVVRSGCIRISERSGDLKWTSFRLPGELFGTQGLFAGGLKRERVAATVDSQLCRLPRSLLLSHSHDNPQLTESIIQAFSAEQALVMASLFRHRMHSEAQVADFLLEMESRLPGRAKDVSVPVELRMSRRDIASHLGMAQETLSRVLKRLSGAGLIAVNGREIGLLDRAALNSMATSGKDSGGLANRRFLPHQHTTSVP